MISQAPPVRFPPPSPFHRDLKQAVDEHFDRTGRSRHGGGRMILNAAVLLGWLAASWAALMFASPGPLAVVLLTISLGLAMAGIGFGVMHDANHGSFSSSSRVNRIVAFTMELLGGSSHLWRQQHNVLHHGFTNVAGADADLEPGALLRFAPWQPWRPYHRFQHLYVWALYAIFPIRWFFWDDYRELVTGRIGGRSFPPARGRTLAVALAGKAVFYGWAVILPLVLHPTWWLVALWLLAALTLGNVLAPVFQLAHCVGEARFHDLPAGAPMSTGWAEHQVTTTVDFARGNRLLGWYVGGLNFQVEHHLFPRVSHLHYPAISRIVETLCRVHGVRYHAEPTLRSALTANVRWLRALGRAPSRTDAEALPVPAAS
jgi:linoleoyl-CoA desaturase